MNKYFIAKNIMHKLITAKIKMVKLIMIIIIKNND
jgi:hypothetical protein